MWGYMYVWFQKKEQKDRLRKPCTSPKPSIISMTSSNSQQKNSKIILAKKVTILTVLTIQWMHTIAKTKGTQTRLRTELASIYTQF